MTNIKWNGDMANEPKVGVVLSETNGNLLVRWSDGREQVIPAFTVVERYGWKRW